jgi:hypothetical protein
MATLPLLGAGGIQRATPSDLRPVAPIDQKSRAGLIIAEFIDGKGR